MAPGVPSGTIFVHGLPPSASAHLHPEAPIATMHSNVTFNAPSIASVAPANSYSTILTTFDYYLPLLPFRISIYVPIDHGSLSPSILSLGSSLHRTDDSAPSPSSSLLFDLHAFDITCHPHAQRAASTLVASCDFLLLFRSPNTSPKGRARLLDGSIPHSSSSFWRRLPDRDPLLSHLDAPLPRFSSSLFSFDDPAHFPIALALDSETFIIFELESVQTLKNCLHGHL